MKSGEFQIIKHTNVFGGAKFDNRTLFNDKVVVDVRELCCNLGVGRKYLLATFLGVRRKPCSNKI
jgi:hypothetical protein